MITSKKYSQTKIDYPECRKEPVTETYFGIELTDEYRWLENAKDPEVLEWVEKENKFTDSWFDQEELAAKIKELRANSETISIEQICKTEDGYVACVQENGIERVIELDRDFKKKKVLLSQYDIEKFSPCLFYGCKADTNLCAYMGMVDGDNKAAYIISNYYTGEIIHKIYSAWYGEWAKEKPWFYYASTDYNPETEKTALRIQEYNVETDKTQPVYEETGIAGLSRIYALDAEHMLVEIWDDFSHWRYVSVNINTHEVHAFNQKAAELIYAGKIGKKIYFISKKRDNHGEVIALQMDQTVDQAEVIRKASNDSLNSGFILGGKLYILAPKDVAAKMYCIDAQEEKEIALPDPMGTASYVSGNEDEVILGFESFIMPKGYFTFDGKEMHVLYQPEYKKHENVIVEQKWAPSVEDGTMIPYFMVHRKDIKPDGQNPTLIYAYGGYNAGVTPWYQDMVTAVKPVEWADRGGIYVLASIRGGNEYGPSWHEGGMKLKKKNCYYDFIGITEQLIQEKWTSPAKIAIDGCSNGGLLMSVLVTMRPDLFGCVIDSVPHTDMIRFTIDDNGPRYIGEYGNPMESKETFEYMLSYSPYHNVKFTNYPATYIQTGELDNNVPPYHGKKFAASMQAHNQNTTSILLRVLAKGAHNRGCGDDYWQTAAEMQLFIEKNLGI